MLGNPAAATAPLPPGHEIDERYKALRDLVGDGPGAPIDQALRSLGDMQQQLAKIAATLVNSGTAPPRRWISSRRLPCGRALRQPQPLARWLTNRTSGSALRSGNPRQQLATRFNASGGLADSVRGRQRPLSVRTGAADDASIAEFARLFAPRESVRRLRERASSALCGHVRQGLAGPVRRCRVGAGVASDLAQFQRAAVIRDMFFAEGGTAPSIRLDITPVKADAATRRFCWISMEPPSFMRRGAPRSTQVTWPGPIARQTARLVFDPPPVGNGGGLQETGPWSLFRLFGRGRMQPLAAGPTDTTLHSSSATGRPCSKFAFQSQGNPFAASVLQDFRCPGVRIN